ncbi:MAG: metallophosphoesterase [Acidobacteria bacterium]|nr:metallophosphoesterase [Acidobacteriota bacterium]
MPLLTLPRATRRQFLAAAGATAASLTFTRSLTASAQDEPRVLRVALLSDTHIPADASERYRGFSPVENLAKVVPAVTGSTVEGTLICGDIARLQGLPEDYARVAGLLAPITAKMPLGMVLGNHDHRANFLEAFPQQRAAAAGVANRHTLSREARGLRFILLDSLLSPNVTPGQLGNAQRTWLATELAASSTPTIAVVHHSLGTNDGELVDADRLFDVLRPHRHVKAILYGHSHEYKVTERDGIQLINIPAVGYNFSDKEPIGWLESTWTTEGVDLTLHAIGGNQAADGQTTNVHWAR